MMARPGEFAQLDAVWRRARRSPFEPVGPERLAKVGHVALEVLARGVRRLLSPDLVDQVFGGHHLVRMEKEARQAPSAVWVHPDGVLCARSVAS